MKGFLSTILPSHGVFFITVNTRSGFRNYPCQSLDEMVQTALRHDEDNLETYHACASFKETSYIDARGKLRQRTAENAGWVKSFWLDIDCSEKKAKGWLRLH